MNGNIKLIILILASIFLISSCNRSAIEESKPENVCTLSPEQVPEIRGFKLGQSFEQISKRFQGVCKKGKYGNTQSSSVDLHFSKDSQTDSDYNLDDCSGTVSKTINIAEYPELNGITDIELKFKHQALYSILIKYDSSEDDQFEKEFYSKVKDSLGISDWTNWKTLEKDDQYISSPRYTTRVFLNQLLCNKVRFETEMRKTNFRVPINDSNVNNTNYKIWNHYTPSLHIETSEEFAMSESQKEQYEMQKRLEQKNIDDKKKEEERKKSEAFKP